MKTFSLSVVILISFFIMSCYSQSENPIKLQTPEDLGKDYINFINNGAKFEDLKKLFLSIDDFSDEDIALMNEQMKKENFNYSTEELKREIVKGREHYMKKIESFWERHNFQKANSFAPYEFLSCNYKEKKDKYIKKITVTVLDNDGNPRYFQIKNAVNLKNGWKIDYMDTLDFHELYNFK